MNAGTKIAQLFSDKQNVIVTRGQGGNSIYRRGYWYVTFNENHERQCLKFKSYPEADAYQIWTQYAGIEMPAFRATDFAERFPRIFKVDEYGSLILKEQAIH